MVEKLKNLTSKKMDTTIIERPNLVEQITNLSSLNQIIETILVEDTQGFIEMNHTVKDFDTVKTIHHKIDYKLKSTRLIIKTDESYSKNIIISDVDCETIRKNKPLCECVARNTNNIFAKEFNKLKSTKNHSIKFLKKNFLEKIFYSDNNSKLISKIKELSIAHSWMIIPNSLIEILTPSLEYVNENVECKALIYNIGKLESTNVYVNPDQTISKIYFGNYDSLTLIINKNLSTTETKTNSLTYPKSMTMEVNYLFIENKPLVSLEVQ